MKSNGRNVVFYAIFSLVALFFLFRYNEVTDVARSRIGRSSLSPNLEVKLNTNDRSIMEILTTNTANMEVEPTKIPINSAQRFQTSSSPPDTVVNPDCECISTRTNKSYDFCYKNPKNASLVGKRFNCSYLSTLEDLKLLDSDLSLVDLSIPQRNPEDVMFVSGISMNHLGNFGRMFEIIKRHWPKQKLILYSLDLTDNTIKKIEEEPNVTIRKFNYSKYPSYVRNWAEYRFKALILAEAIRDYPNVWWTDSHNRWLQPKPLGQFYGDIAHCMKDVDCDQKSSIMMFVNASHSNYAVLTAGLLDYFPTYGVDTLKYNDKGLQLSAAFVYLARTPFTMEILKWHALCALEEKCMNPPTAKLKCDIIPRWDVYAGCFRNHNHYFMNVGKVDRTYDHY